MVVLFPNGPRRPGPYAVPAYALTRRTERGTTGEGVVRGDRGAGLVAPGGGSRR
ncbi:hypothetical protein [Amycolatopsis tolypomycina]|uniref:hypothetical protein n=1 Tax=Amycolatopsis tolypomycina TaxID=208445 RepID=UPI00339F43AD